MCDVIIPYIYWPLMYLNESLTQMTTTSSYIIAIIWGEWLSIVIVLWLLSVGSPLKPH